MTARPSPFPFTTLPAALRARVGHGGTNGYAYRTESGGDGGRLSFADLSRRARAVAAALRKRTVPGDRALLCYPPGLEFLAGLFGCFEAGVIAVPLPVPRLNAVDPKYGTVVRDCAPALTLTDSTILARGSRLPAGPAWLDTTPLTESDDAPPFDGPTDSIAMLQYTSGSTGDPKGVRLTHSNLLNNCAAISRAMGFAEETHVVCWLPHFHDMGLIGNLINNATFGGRITILSPAAVARDPIVWFRTISDVGASVTGGPCSAFRHAAARATPESCAGLDLSRLRLVYTGAEPVVPGVLDAFSETFAPYGFRRDAFYPCYGLAEASLMLTGGPPGQPVVRAYDAKALTRGVARPDAAGRPLVGCGEPVTDTTISVRDPQSGADCPEGRIGEIVARGPGVSSGYWGRDDFGPDLFTGDLGFVDGGQLFVTGRKKELIIVRGQNLYPADIEQAVAAAVPALAGLTGSAFALDATADADAELVLVQEVTGDMTVGERERAWRAATATVADTFGVALGRLAFVRKNAVARTSSGKVRRGEYRAKYESGELEIVQEFRAPTVVPVPPLEVTARTDEAGIRAWLTARLAAHVGVAPSDIDPVKPFASYGLDSMALVGLSGDLQSWLGRDVPVTAVYGAPTVASLASAVAGGRDKPGPVTVAPTADRVAVVGLGCRFPGANGPDEFWELLAHGRSAIRELPAGRWPHVPEGVPTRGGYLDDDVRHFDAEFFGISPREAASLDPQHRHVLEVAWTALEHAGIVPATLAGRSVGVFVGISGGEYARILFNAGEADGHAGSGNAAAMAAHRVSYHFDLRGPSLTIDTACSSSLVAIHQACQSLRLGECELALAGGVNLILGPDLSDVLAKAGMLSPDGVCKTFTADADGYARGEGCGLVVLKPLVAAERDGDRILAVVEATAVNQDGKSNGITAPNGAAQADLIRTTLARAGRDAAAVTVLECHGTGTKLGDPIEIRAAADALGATGEPCTISSVKANVGHLESAAGVAGFVKLVLQIANGKTVPHRLSGPVNPLLPFAGTRLRIADQLRDWPGPRVGAVSAFGFGGTNAHAVLSSYERAGTSAADADITLLPVSAASPESLVVARVGVSSWLRRGDSTASEIASTAAHRRSHFPHRRAVVGATPAEWADALGRPYSPPDVRFDTRRVAFLYSGQGGQAADTGRRLRKSFPAFRSAWERCDAAYRSLTNESIDALADPDDPLASHVANFVLGVCLTETWAAFGITPGAVLGHSIGEFAAAVAAGAYPMDEALGIVVARGRAARACPPGVLIACAADAGVVRDALDVVNERATVACVNGPTNTVVSCDPKAAFDVELACSLAGIGTKRLAMTRAYHSPHVAAVAAAVSSFGVGSATRIPIVSTVTGERLAKAPDGDYWVRHATGAVRFADGIRSLIRDGFTHFVELGPATILTALGPAIDAGAGRAWVPSLRRNVDERMALLRAAGDLYEAGAELNWPALVPRTAGLASLPTYPFRKVRLGFDEPPRNATAPAVPAGWVPESDWAECRPRTALTAPPLNDLFAGATVAAATADDGFRPHLDHLCGRYAAGALDSLGRTRDALPAYGRLVRRLESLAMPGDSPVSLVATLRARFPDRGTELALVERCGAALADVARGAADPVAVLFGDGGQLLGDLYARSPAAKRTNGLLAAAVAALANPATATRPLRILELGGGTGGTTVHLLPNLPDGRFEYAFTDVSASFLAGAAATVGDRPGFRTATLDVERPPVSQGFAEGQFDLVVAANVLHATKDLRQSVAHARRLLAPGGVLALVEGTGPTPFLDIVFGLTDGWWRFADSNLRPEHALLTPTQWAALLRESGFADVAADPAATDTADQVVILARADATAFSDAPPRRTDAAGPSLVRGDQRFVPARVTPAPTAPAPSVAALRAMPPGERAGAALAFLTAEFAKLLGTDAARIDPDTPLTAFGLDSLLAIQFHNRVERALGPVSTVVELVKGLTLRAAAERAVERLAGGSEAPVAAAPTVTVAGVDALTDDELDRAFAALITAPAG